ncbi:hypothetical protein U1Q18_029851 [Sarracenia purpurea var. burkii]
MGGGGTSKSNRNAPKARTRVEADAISSAPSSLKRAHDGSAFTRCDKCSKHVAVALMDFHDCGIEAQIEKTLDAQMAECEKFDAVSTEKEEKSTEPKPKKVKKEKKAKDPNVPKRPQTAFFLFMVDFRKSYKEANPDCKSVSTVAKEGGEKWKSMTDEEKKPYVDRAAELKVEYGKAMKNSHNDAQHADDEVSGVEEAKVVTVSDD